MKELAEGVYSLGHGKGGHVHASLLDAGGELSLVDTPVEGDARLVRKPGELIPFQLGPRLDRPRRVPCPVDELLEEGDAFGQLQALHAPDLSPGWKVFNLNHAQHKRTLTRIAALEAAIVGVGHGEPITDDATDKVGQLAEALRLAGGSA